MNMLNPEIKATTPLEEILEITSEHGCDCKDTSCCAKFRPNLVWDEVQEILGYLGIKYENFGEFFDEGVISFKEWYLPKKYQKFCIFAVKEEDKQTWLEQLRKKLEQPENVKKAKKKERLYCAVQEVKPKQCRIYHCKMPKEVTSWEIEHFYVDRDDPRTLKEFRKDVNKFRLPILEDSVLQK